MLLSPKKKTKNFTQGGEGSPSAQRITMVTWLQIHRTHRGGPRSMELCRRFEFPTTFVSWRPSTSLPLSLSKRSRVEPGGAREVPFRLNSASPKRWSWSSRADKSCRQCRTTGASFAPRFAAAGPPMTRVSRENIGNFPFHGGDAPGERPANQGGAKRTKWNNRSKALTVRSLLCTSMRPDNSGGGE